MRTLERRIGAICRAVAVKVAEKKLQQTPDQTGESKDTESGVMKGKADKGGSDAMMDENVSDVANLTLPPEMPIVIDEQAVEDILGVKCFNIFHNRVITPWPSC